MPGATGAITLRSQVADHHLVSGKLSPPLASEHRLQLAPLPAHCRRQVWSGGNRPIQGAASGFTCVAFSTGPVNLNLKGKQARQHPRACFRVESSYLAFIKSLDYSDPQVLRPQKHQSGCLRSETSWFQAADGRAHLHRAYHPSHQRAKQLFKNLSAKEVSLSNAPAFLGRCWNPQNHTTPLPAYPFSTTFSEDASTPLSFYNKPPLSGSARPKGRQSTNRRPSLLLCRQAKEDTQNLIHTPKDTNSASVSKEDPVRRHPAAKSKVRFKRAQFSEIPQEQARALLTPQYSAAQGIPYREAAEFRLWVMLMMAGPEHVLLAEKDDYIFRDGRRLVRPYFFEFVSHVKSRWAGQNIVELFSNEFRQRDRQYYFLAVEDGRPQFQAVEDGRLQVDGRKVPPSYCLRQGQTVVHFVHRHEPPVMDQPVKVLFSDADVVVVQKPASVPVHPCGQYRKNTVLGILQAEHPELGTLSPIHRLDRLVSGLLILVRNPATADRFRQDITANEVQKEYVARVVGVFPEWPVEANVPLLYDGKEGRSIVEELAEVNDPAAIANAMANGGRSREALTRFRRLSTDGTTSVVACQPLTGRTHQIRVHLQYLGHPIANDFLYLYPGALPEEARRRGGDTTADVAAARGAAKMAAKATVAGCALVGAIRVVVAAKARKAREEEEATRRQGLGVLDLGGPGEVPGRRGLEEGLQDGSREGLQDGLQEGLPEGTQKGLQQGSKQGLKESSQEGLREGSLGSVSAEWLVDGGAREVVKCRSDESERKEGEASIDGVSNVSEVSVGGDSGSSGTGPASAEGKVCREGVDTEALFEVDPYCTNCPSIGPTGYEEDQEGLWLHCIRYTGKTWSYECPLPDWAQLA